MKECFRRTSRGFLATTVELPRKPSRMDGMNMAGIYIGTILLERNRWAPGKVPTYLVSQWLERFRTAGFDGIELWENHAALCPEDERVRLEALAAPVAVFNSYAGFDTAGEVQRRLAAAMAVRLRAQAVKFNMGPDPGMRVPYVQAALEWRTLFPAHVRLLCECHPGTVMEEPQAAAEVFAQCDGFEAIVHPFTWDLERLAAWFRLLGPKITHAHVQLRTRDDLFLRLDRDPGYVREALAVMREGGFRGSFTLEFAEGTRSASENMEELFSAVLADLAFLRENWPG